MEVFRRFEEFFSNKNIDLKRIYFYSGNSVIENYKNKINSKITVFSKFYFLMDVFRW